MSYILENREVQKSVTGFGTKSVLAVFFGIVFQHLLLGQGIHSEHTEEAATDVLVRIIGIENAADFHLEHVENEVATDRYSISVENNRVNIKGTSPVALCRAAYDYLRSETASIVSWSGSRINIPDSLPECTREVSSPFKYRYYFNSVTHGYTTPYWDWDRWEKEIDWMALHGMNMPLIAGAHEAILLRVFLKLGLTEEEALQYFSGPAHFPWNRMGNIGGWDGPPPTSFFEKQIELTHRMLDRMSALAMHPIAHAFAGFVPQAITRLYPDEELRELGWGGFDQKVHILSPYSDLFLKIGKMYIELWEAEFGKGAFYLADSFNEMDVPLPEDQEEALAELAAFGEAVYRPIAEANPDAVWVMQGWTFPYHRDDEGKLFWTPDRLSAFMSRVPDDRLLILDMANEYNALFWKIDYSWEMYDGFFGKQWIYSFIPNMGGKVPHNGVLNFYASAPAEAIAFPNKQNLVGFGFAPEGIENNELIYELLSDWGWREDPIDLDRWVAMYARARYGAYPQDLRKAFYLLLRSSWGTFTDHPRFRYQFRPGEENPTVHHSPEFYRAVHLFLKAADDLSEEELYVFDALELGAQYLGHKIDSLLMLAGDQQAGEDMLAYQQAIDLMKQLDRLLASHPLHKLSNWINLARDFGDSEDEKLYYESNAKRLNTTWGGGVNEYAARTWSGLIGSYYAERWRLWLKGRQEGITFDMKKWEEQWITAKWSDETRPFEDPLKALRKVISEYP